MNSMIKVSLAFVAAAATSLSATNIANAGGLFGGKGVSMKDTMAAHQPSAGRCYLRGDVGYSHGEDPSATFTAPTYGTLNATSESIEGTWMGEIGIGCGSGSRGFRADFTLGYRGDRDIDGHKPATPVPGHFEADFSSKVDTLTAMANLYYDFGRFRNFVPYVGVGIGVARHDVGNVSFTGVGAGLGATFNDINGTTDTNFAWSLMAGAAYQISHRAVLDFGYRYIDMGDVNVRGDICTTSCGGGSDDRLSIDDLHAHEFKIGLRYHFGGRRHVAYK